MLLHTPVYLLFLAVVAAAYWALPQKLARRATWRKALLLAASYAFYAFFDLRFAALLLALTIAVYWIGKQILRGAHARFYALLSIAINLGVLWIFKYLGFFLDSLKGIGFQPLSPALTLLLPVGISFYTFQAISYTTEIARKKSPGARSLADFALYLAFFPKLIAGPLVRPVAFLDQLDGLPEQPGLSGDEVRQAEIRPASSLLLLGLFKKVVIADSLASLTDAAFRAAALPLKGQPFPSPLFIQGFYLYAFQIYADFSGYTDIARASAMLLGFRLPENFQQPYLSATITSFWNRWHMTLTQWFREYLFFPLSRKLLTVTRRKYPRLIQTGVTLATMSLIGLWHGPAWTFVAWGLWHGIWLCLENLSGYKPSGRWTRFAAGVVAFHLVGIGWVLFRSDSFAAAGRFLKGMLAFNQMQSMAYYLPVLLVVAGLVFAIDLVSSKRISIPSWLQRLAPILVIAAWVLLASLYLLEFARGGLARPFIYGQF